MKRSFRGASVCLAMTLVLSMFAALNPGCGTVDANGFFGLGTCEVLNCDGLFFGHLADDHDDMASMDGMDDADAHDDGDDEHLDGVDDHDDDGDDDHMDDMGDHDNGDDDHMDDMDEHNHDDAEEEEHDDATEGDDQGGPAVARS